MCHKRVVGLFIFLYLGISYSQVTLPNQPIKDALFLHNTVTSNKTLKDCPFRPANNLCPDEDITITLYANGDKEVVDYVKPNWMTESIRDDTKEDIIVIHGYASGPDTLPIVVLKDAYINNGSYNLWMVNWAPLSEPPCYRGAVHNLRAVGRCLGELLTSIKLSGRRTDKITCLGHSLGAHICGLMTRGLTFRLSRIIALDPARPLITPMVKLDSRDAEAVHVMHTNAGHYGEKDKVGHADFCVNGGRTQPFCENIPFNVELCSHIWAICYMAESLHPELAKKALPCSRRCPPPPRPIHKVGLSVLMGQYTPKNAVGSFCLNDNRKNPPYCPKNPGDIGDKRCCLDNPDIGTVTTESMDISSDVTTTTGYDTVFF